PADYADNYPELVESEKALLHSKINEYQSRQQHYQQLIKLKETELNNVMQFTHSGAIAKREVVAIEQALATLKAEKDNFLADYQKKQATELADAVSQLALLNETIKTTRDQLRRTSVLAPASGTVNQIFFNTVGAVVSPGQTILEIVPNNEDKMLVETRVLPKDIGYVTLEMRSTLKLTAYDYSIYGTLKGKVVKIGADTVPDKHHRDQPPSYVVTLEIDPDSLQAWLARGLELRTGMVVEAELEAGSMRIIDYIFRPLLKTRDAMATI
ncbi:HlyD family efflux transporter periplasmic adaptor subunit, partial [Frederiksenia canicola]